MKLFFISDIHGSLHYLSKALEAFENEKADYIVILGDELYHGPRNNLPESYKPNEVAVLLNKYKEKIIAIRGNCDCEVDQMLIDYPMMSDYSIIFYEGRRLFITHGHIFNKNNMPNLNNNDILFYGHTHIPDIEKYNNIYLINPGSISLPKEGHPNTFGILEGLTFKILDFEGNVYKQITFD